MKNTRIAFIGAGNMGASLIAGLVQDKYPVENIWVSDPNEEILNQLEKEYGVHTNTDNHTVIANADVVLFAVKPQLLLTIAQDLSELIQGQKPLVISIAAGVRENDLRQSLGNHIPIVRCMPNIAALIGCGATGLFANHYVTELQKGLAETILRAVGVTQWLEKESDLDTVTALSGSGPAYFFLIMEALEEVALAQGLNQKTAHLFTIQTALGAAQMAMQSDLKTAQLREKVTSTGGTTEAALKVLEAGQIRQLLQKAMLAAKNRASEIADQISEQG